MLHATAEFKTYCSAQYTNLPHPGRDVTSFRYRQGCRNPYHVIDASPIGFGSRLMPASNEWNPLFGTHELPSIPDFSYHIGKLQS
ncbi:predicted protein [Sclerotinia sclerotiorum 1980 UF-70]|uniref:Uncharacterized protein n=1 Tax=Sclerotinia sclerotiorum (strain ATCC 18683 / 1980 / Ss-1) TaxID=665079 RepID=A7F427_SCLS1|nr:predicted protein [Sclerotinia sclerotiorum 1980 UF-70]EDN97498.1 predicted protein [Sclerotinia sclerotiorum 1980 UF-70]